jgi:hypothetical protein
MNNIEELRNKLKNLGVPSGLSMYRQETVVRGGNYPISEYSGKTDDCYYRACGFPNPATQLVTPISVGQMPSPLWDLLPRTQR